MKVSVLTFLLALCIMLTACPKEKEYVHVGENWAALNKIEGKDYKVKLVVNKGAFKVGEEIILTVQSDKPGKVWLISVGKDDNPMVIYPNELATENEIKANEPFLIPPASSSWKMKAAPPAGEDLVLTLVTDSDVDLDGLNTILGRNTNKAIAIEQGLPKWGAAKKVIKIEE